MPSKWLDVFKKSNAWSNKYQLPLVPQHNNPFLYTAYALKILRELRDTDAEMELIPAMRLYSRQCFSGEGMMNFTSTPDNPKHPVNRWPAPRKDLMSFDEIMGFVSIGHFPASFTYDYIREHWGFYNNTGEKGFFLKFWLYRFMWLMPWIRSNTSRPTGFFRQMIWSLLVLAPDLLSVARPDTHHGQYLRTWLMLDSMGKLKYSGWFVRKWKAKMKRLGFGPKECFVFYLRECPAFHSLAPDNF